MTRKILILGSTGFIGMSMKNFFQNRYDLFTPTRQELDVLDYQAVGKYLSSNSFDVVLNALDSRVGETDYFEKRIRMFMNLQSYNCLYGKMIYFGSGAEYGKQLPIIKVVEEDVLQRIPSDRYGLCMRTISEIADNSRNIYNLRLFGIFGPNEVWETRFISNAICKILFDIPISIRQNAVFDYLYIEDLCRIVEWMIGENPLHHVYNAVSDNSNELINLANFIREQMNSNLPILVAKNGFAKEYTASNKRILHELDFKATPLNESISLMISWYRGHIKDIDKYWLLYQEDK